MIKSASVAQVTETQCAPTGTVYRRSRGSIPRVGQYGFDHTLTDFCGEIVAPSAVYLCDRAFLATVKRSAR